MLLEHCQGWQLQHLLGEAIPVPAHSERRSFFLISNLNFLWYNLWPFPQVLFVAWEKRPNPKGMLQYSPMQETTTACTKKKRFTPTTPRTIFPSFAKVKSSKWLSLCWSENTCKTPFFDRVIIFCQNEW